MKDTKFNKKSGWFHFYTLAQSMAKPLVVEVLNFGCQGSRTIPRIVERLGF